MPRKSKDAYERKKLTLEKISSLEREIKKQKENLIAIDKEIDEYEMRKMFQSARENNLTIDEVIDALNMFSVKQQVNKTKITK